MFKKRLYKNEYKVQYREDRGGPIHNKWIAGLNKADAIKHELTPWKKAHKSITIVKITLVK